MIVWTSARRVKPPAPVACSAAVGSARGACVGVTAAIAAWAEGVPVISNTAGSDTAGTLLKSTRASQTAASTSPIARPCEASLNHKSDGSGRELNLLELSLSGVILLSVAKAMLRRCAPLVLSEARMITVPAEERQDDITVDREERSLLL